MKISYNWLKQYIDVDLPVEETGDILTEIGLEVEGVDKFESIPGGLAGVVIGLVTQCEKHPNADKLSVTKVNVGIGEELQIVCGAPNVAVGQKVAVATVGTVLHPISGDPFKIKKSKIRGTESHGMICAEDELGLGESHDGILVLPADLQPGMKAAEHFNIETDSIFEIGLTPNRSDATSHFGVAEDLAAALKINYEGDGKVAWPNVDAFSVASNELPVSVEVENEMLCPRYSGVTIKGVKVGSSPVWLVNRLASIGIRSTNNIVDITNYVLHELGQPLHAFDLDHVADNKILVKTLPEGTMFTTLDEVERKLSAEDLMICNGNSDPMCIGGVFGGLTSGVTESTTAIFLESAHFNAKSNRRSSMRHNLRTDAAKIFEKGSDPNRTVYALKHAALLIQEVAGGEVVSDIVDIYPNPIAKKEVEVSIKNVNRLIGADLSKNEIKAIFDALNIEVLEELTSDNSRVEGYRVSIPTNKADVVREVDVIEEILRIYGFNRVEVSNKIQSSLSFTRQPVPHKMRNLVGDFLASNGFFEIMGLSITQSKYFEIIPSDTEQHVHINNTSNQHLDVMRPEIMASMLETIVHNQNRQNPDLRLFEFGKTYQKQEEEYNETQHLSLAVTGSRDSESWHMAKQQEVGFYTIKAFVHNTLERMGIAGFQSDEVDDKKLSFGLRYFRGPNELVRYGKIESSILKKMDIRKPVYFADFNWDNILKALKNHKIHFEDMPKFPTMRRDLALVLDSRVSFREVEAISRKEAKKVLQSINLFDVYKNEEKIGKDKKSYSVSFVFQDPHKTMKDKEVDGVMNKIMKSCEGKLGAVIRR